jgi:hypothetical protein
MYPRLVKEAPGTLQPFFGEDKRFRFAHYGIRPARPLRDLRDG